MFDSRIQPDTFTLDLSLGAVTNDHKLMLQRVIFAGIDDVLCQEVTASSFGSKISSACVEVTGDYVAQDVDSESDAKN